MKTNISECNGCGVCIDSCMVWAIKMDEKHKAERDELSCMSCRECENVCPKGAISYEKING
ncbi:MAG: 4Fe-4S dicluster domain-containing protein [Nitrospinae bacterium]|nr:4Fe-4S dicluster domain-containing protein [Nitrospinota bacterium]